MAKKAAGREGYQNKSRRPCVTADIERYCRGLNEWPRRDPFSSLPRGDG